MELIGELNNTDLTIEIDLHDLKNEMDLADLIEDGCRDYIDNVDFSDYISIEGDIDELLSQYDGMNSPCGLGKSFEKAVWWAMSRQGDENDEQTIRGDEEKVRRIVREELRNLLVNTLNIEAQGVADASVT